MRTSTKFLIAFVLSAGVLLLSATAGLLLCMARDLGYAATWPNTFGLAGLFDGILVIGSLLAMIGFGFTAVDYAEKERR